MTDTASSVRGIADDVWRYKLETQPVLRARRGLPVHEIRGASLQIAEKDARFAAGALRRLDTLDAAGLSHDDVLTAAFLRHTLEIVAEAPTHYWHHFPITPYSIGLQISSLGQYVFSPFHFDGAESLETYLRLVSDLAGLLRDSSDKVAGQIERGIILPRAAIAGARETLHSLAGAARALLVPAPERLASVAADAAERIERLVVDEVEAAYTRIIGLVDEAYEARAPLEVGVGQYEGGNDYYRFAIRERNLLDLDPERIHEIGLEQIELLSEGMAKVRATIGFAGSEAEFHEQLRNEPRLFAKTPEEVEARYLGYIARLEPLIGAFFSVLPKAPYGVTRLEPELEGALTYGYYRPPSPDIPTGQYHYNASQLDKRSLLNAAAIIYHELVPGHHFHIARQHENEALPDVRREALEIGAFNEGWAEYAASLAGEMGLLDDPLDHYGHLAHQRFTAQRLVVDTGMNVLGWPLERGRAYMKEMTFESDVQVATETLRYSTDLPAQALGYRLGYLAIRGARERAEKALGSSFDIRDFHEAILGQSALPLPVLDDHIDWFVDRHRSAR